LVVTFFRASLAGALALGLLWTAPALAQGDAAPSGSGRAPSGPTDSKQYGDWLVRCFPVKSPSPCDMFELLANKQNQQRIMSVSIAYVPSGDRHVIQIAVPLGVMIQKGLVMTADGFTTPMLHYRRCDRGGCYVEMLMPPELLTALTTSTESKVTIYAEGGKAFTIPFSLKGFNDAHGAMSDLARKKTGGAAAAPATPAPDQTAPAPGDSTTPAPDATTPSP
jgi:invasion protein IalB